MRKVRLPGAIYGLVMGILIFLLLPICAFGSNVVTGSFTVGLVITNVSPLVNNNGNAIISWETNSNATSQVFYDIQSHENVTDFTYHSGLDMAPVTEHSVTLSGLSPSVTNYCIVKSVATINGIEFVAISPEFTFLIPASHTGGGGGVAGSGVTGENNEPGIIEIDVPGNQAKLSLNADGSLAQSYSQSFLDGSVILSFDAGTIINAGGTIPSRISVEETLENPPVPGNMERVSPVYSITAYIGDLRMEQVTFSRPFRFIVSYDEEKLPANTSGVFVAYYDSTNGWVQLDSPPGFIAAAGQVAAFVNHFSLFAVFATAEAPKPAYIELNSLQVIPENAHPGDTVTIIASFTNSGGMPGEYVLKIKVTDLLDTTRLVEIDSGKTNEVTIEVVPANPGEYSVEVGNLTAKFAVRASSEGMGLFYWFYIFIAMVILIIFLAAWILIRRRQKRKEKM